MQEPNRGRSPRRTYPPAERAPADGLYECAPCRRAGKTFQVYLRRAAPFPACPRCGASARWRESRDAPENG